MASNMTPQQHSGSAILQFSKNSPPPAHVLKHKDAPICPSTASQGAETPLYTSNMDVGSSRWEFAASTMTPQHHTGLTIPHYPLNSPPPAYVLRHKGVPICPSTSSQGVQTLHLHPIWMWEAVNGGAASTMTPQHHTGTTIPHFL